MRVSTLLLVAVIPAFCEPMTSLERRHLAAHIEMTNEWLRSEVTALTQAQLNFRPAIDAWSISEVVQHLAIAEPQYWKQLQEGLTRPRSTDKGSSTDEQVMWYGIDRSNRQKTGEARVPHGQFKSAAEALESWAKLRGEMLAFAKATDANLRDHDLGPRTYDLYQWFLMISAHSQRHILQIREIKAAAGYPAK